MAANGGAPAGVVQGYALLREGRVEEAVRHAAGLLRGRSGDVDALVLASEAAVAAGAPDAAVGFMEEAIGASPGNAALRLKQAGLLLHLRRRHEALGLALSVAATARERGSGQALWQAGSIVTNCNRPLDAVPLYQQALEAMGPQPGLLYDLAVAQFFTGDFDAAEANLDRMLAIAPQAGHALYLRSTLRRQSPDHNHVEELRQRIAAGLGRPDQDAAAWYALAKELEDLGEHASAFDALDTGARLRRQTLDHDIAGECEA